MTVIRRSGRLRCLRDLVAIDSVNPSLVAGSARRGRRRAADCGRARVDRSPRRDHRRRAGPSQRRRRARGPRAGPLADVLRAHRHGRRERHALARSTPEIRDGRLYGRGAQDMKGGVAAMIGAVRRIVESGGLARGRVIVAAVVDEEHASIGADALVAQVACGRRRGDRADRPRHRRRAQGLSVDRARDARPRGAWQPAARRARRDSADGPRARAPRGARPASSAAGHRIRCSAPRRCTRRSSRAVTS